MLNHFPTPIIFAHRGASAHAPENTLAAFELAVAQGAPAVELDVKLTSDRYLVVLHDHTLQRTTNGSGLLAATSFEALRELDAGSWKDAKFAGEKVPLLEEVLEVVGKKVLINIELTNYTTPYDGLPHEVIALVQKHGLQDRVIFSSFNFNNLILAKKNLPETPCGQLILPGRTGWLERLAARFIQIEAEHPFTADVDEAYVERTHKRDRRVHVWTVNDPADMRRLRSFGVDGIFTDDPLLAQEHFK